ncbi:hypothetical protein BDW74DRAFT_180490 [Aspergillus multicolor]|uniref:uncharacterized protein n=1 Tax=Aspergillus multicolor TaxID=41759 RepID=UPI003CCD5BF2
MQQPTELGQPSPKAEHNAESQRTADTPNVLTEKEDWRSWMQVVGAFCLNTWGLMNAFGAF